MGTHVNSTSNPRWFNVIVLMWKQCWFLQCVSNGTGAALEPNSHSFHLRHHTPPLSSLYSHFTSPSLKPAFLPFSFFLFSTSFIHSPLPSPSPILPYSLLHLCSTIGLQASARGPSDAVTHTQTLINKQTTTHTSTRVTHKQRAYKRAYKICQPIPPGPVRVVCRANCPQRLKSNCLCIAAQCSNKRVQLSDNMLSGTVSLSPCSYKMSPTGFLCYVITTSYQAR